MNIIRRPVLGYPHTRFVAVVLAISLTAMLGLALPSKADVTTGIADLLATCEHCSSTVVPNSNSTLN